MQIRRLFEKHPHWQEVLEAYGKLKSAGFEAYLAGGCVRDALMGRLAQDFDLATNARPDEIEGLFSNILSVGRQFGVMMLPISNGARIEIATFRADLDYVDGRRPQGIQYSSPKEDALRRDFTINALFYDLSGDRIIDFVGGISDLENKVIKAVGPARQRFDEDKLRMLRAIRFKVQLGFEIDAETLEAIKLFAGEIKVVSKERVTDEIKKMVKFGGFATGLELMREVGLLKHIWPDLTFATESEELWKKALLALHELSWLGSFEVLVALLIIEEGFFRQLGQEKTAIDWDHGPFTVSRETKREIEFLVRGYFAMLGNDEKSLLMLNEESGPLLTEICYALEQIDQFPKGTTGAVIERFLQVSDKNGHLPTPFLKGEDLIEIGVSPSKEMGSLLSSVYLKQIAGEIKTRESAIEFIKSRIKN